MFRKTPVAARELGITYHRLMGLLRHGKIAPPDRDSSGDYLWTDADLDRARQALAAAQRERGRDGRGRFPRAEATNV
jgi:DNA-binding transcriptional MerR regulator